MTRSIILSFGVSAAACISAYQIAGRLGSQTATTAAQPSLASTVGGLFIDPNELALGEVHETTAYSLRLNVRNLTEKTKVVTGFQGSCACASIEPREMRLPPGGVGAISLVIDLTMRSPDHSGLSRRAFSLRIDPIFADDFAPSTGWVVAADVLSDVTVETTRVGFAEGCVARGEPIVWRVRVRTHTPLAGLTADVQPASAGAASLLPVGPSELSLAISPSPTLPPGPFDFKVFLRPIGTDGQSLPPIRVEVDGEMQATVRAFPRTVLCGEVETPGAVTAEVVLTLPPGTEWQVGRIECDSEATDVVALGPGPDGGLLYRITHPVTQAGDHLTGVRLVVHGPDDRKEVVRVELRYHGRAR
jgi:hypothetical protein